MMGARYGLKTVIKESRLSKLEMSGMSVEVSLAHRPPLALVLPRCI